ncbi:MAG TPA: hypothetical protein VFL57_00450 [Bryobacteraceae bacterium]|nr:hypothetical protein [Bryobacteraceae bacterium]
MGYLDAYGAGEERRAKIVRTLVLSLIILAVLAGIVWWRFRNWAENKRVEQFFSDLRGGDYKSAYSLWGCTDARPCRDYSFDRFMEDWGPKSAHANLSAMQVAETKSCSGGVIKILKFPADEVVLWVDRQTKTIGFSPWPVCNPRMQVDLKTGQPAQ